MFESRLKWVIVPLATLGVAWLVLSLVACAGRGGVTFKELLDIVPDTPETRTQVEVNNYARVRELYNLALPGPNASEDDLVDYFFAVNGVQRDSLQSKFHPADVPWIGVGGRQYFEAFGVQFRKYLAFDVRDIDQTILAGVPPGRLEVLKGRFDPKATDVALRACSECASPSLDQHRNVAFYSWGADLELNIHKRFAPPAYDQLGRGGRIAVQDRHVFRTVETPGMKLLIDTSSGKRRSLADLEEFRLLAEALDRLGAFAAFLSDRTQGADGTLQLLSPEYADKNQLDAIRKKLEQSPLLRPYQAVALGVGKDDKGLYMALALVHANSQAATDNVTQLRRRILETSSFVDNRPWRDRIVTTDIRADGRLLEARLYGDIARSWREWYLRRDPLLAHN